MRKQNQRTSSCCPDHHANSGRARMWTEVWIILKPYYPRLGMLADGLLSKAATDPWRAAAPRKGSCTLEGPAQAQHSPHEEAWSPRRARGLPSSPRRFTDTWQMETGSWLLLCHLSVPFLSATQGTSPRTTSSHISNLSALVTDRFCYNPTHHADLLPPHSQSIWLSLPRRVMRCEKQNQKPFIAHTEARKTIHKSLQHP